MTDKQWWGDCLETNTFDNLTPEEKGYGTRECPSCQGAGWVWVPIRWGHTDARKRVCPACHGKGRIPL